MNIFDLKTQLLLFVIGLGILSSAGLVVAADLSIEVKQLRNTQGSLLLAVYDNEQDYEQDQSKNIFAVLSKKVSRTQQTITFHDVPDGRYAVTVIHDENGNDELDISGRTPLEGLAYSGTKSRLTKPSFQRASTHIDGNDQTLVIQLNYYND